ncbi:MAG: tetratricopeptide repeat protein [Flavobacteriaceae bacterium]|nr:tetratricopeptide repeat protein [Flavobacteriaceae bacterium]
MHIQKSILFFLTIGIVLVSCSTRKDRFLNRTYNAITTKYNILYNGNIAFDEGLKELRQKHKDNFWEQLSLEPITFDKEEIKVPSFNNVGAQNKTDQNQTASKGFDKAEEKAVKAIQKHSMNIGGKERNHQIDDAYLLLGKSRYYTQRFVPAIEAFNYVIVNYPYADLVNETRVWRAKTNIRLDNEKFAIESLKIVLKTKDLASRVKEEAHTALAMAYVKIDSIQKAIQQLNLAAQTQENVNQTARNMFVLGQLYASQQKTDSAAWVYQSLINFKKAPHKFKIHAHINLAKTTSKDDVENQLVKFEKLIKNRDNRNYLDKLYYQKGLLEESRDSLQKAIVYFNKSLRVAKGEKTQKTVAYEKLGDIAYSNSLFVKASSYYDSVLQLSKKSTDKRIRKIRRKHKSLSKLTAFEKVIQTNDSILKIATLTASEQKAFFEKHIAFLKEVDEKKAKQQLKNSYFGSAFRGGSSNLRTNKGKWYFYNRQSLNFGKATFQKVWGNRPLEDNWRLSDKQQTTVSATSKNNAVTKKVLPKHQLETYLKAIPTTKQQLDSLRYTRNEALYQTGVIYKVQFKDTDLAIDRLERLLKENPDKSLVLPTKYHLYQLYTETQSAKALSFKNEIIRDYPKSKYADILQNKPKKLDQKSVSQTEAIYKELYYIYKENKFSDVVSQINELLPTIKESNLIAKFELLKALAIGKYQSKADFRKALEHVSFNYGNTLEGQRAKELIKQLK